MTLKFIILGSGSSLGVPRIDGFFGACNPNIKRNYRSRCSALIKTKNMNIIIDTSPDIKMQLTKNNVTKIDAVLYSHFHADQTHGINDLRGFYLSNKLKIPLYADTFTKKYLASTFNYCFKQENFKERKGYPPIMILKQLKKINYFYGDMSNIKIRSISVKHGNINCMSFIINDKLAYASDVSKIYMRDFKYFKNLEYLVVDCLRYESHPSHFNLDQVLKLVKILKPKKTILTNLGVDIDYKEIKKRIPKNIIPGYDGMTINL
jgi:phosphoribosyl 1,2-cyclic phosphate phosphodiesterase